MYKKLILLLLLVMISIFSCSPYFLALDPSTWIAFPLYVSEFDLSFLIDFNSQFYRPYSITQHNQEFVTRKIGHMVVYASLASLFFINLDRFRLRSRFFASWGLVSVVGLVDEINQYFIIGRDGRFMDVLLNSLSGFAVVTTVAIFILLKGTHSSFGKRIETLGRE